MAINLVKSLHSKENRTYDLILMDLSMPICTGSEATVAITSFLKDKDYQERPYICCLSSHHDKKSLKQAKDAGMDDFVTKPIFSTGLRDLLSKVRKVKISK